MTDKAMQEHLERYVADGIIASWAVPDHYVFVDELPKTSVGKIDKKVLRCRYRTA
jgi:fatty-acyl-CoA synthase